MIGSFKYFGPITVAYTNILVPRVIFNSYRDRSVAGMLLNLIVAVPKA